MPPRPTELESVLRGKRILVTGHTGFKGGWLVLWCTKIGAEVTGYALPPTPGALFDAIALSRDCRSVEGDVRDLAKLEATVREAKPDAVLHLAAQPLVRRSYDEPIETLTTNIVGTANVLEAVRCIGNPCVVVVITTDKCYEPHPLGAPLVETDRLGGADIYSVSKAGAELLVDGYRRSFFPLQHLQRHGIRVATARAGNVFGGGDWADDRLVPDAMRALNKGLPIVARRPNAIRPWQHVLEPLAGYLMLAARLLSGSITEKADLCGPWNFGPDLSAMCPVSSLLDALVQAWGSGKWQTTTAEDHRHETGVLRLSSEKSIARLGWQPRWDLETAIGYTVEWYRAFFAKVGPSRLRALSNGQIDAYQIPRYQPYQPVKVAS